jgi:hypothetical protein
MPQLAYPLKFECACMNPAIIGYLMILRGAEKEGVEVIVDYQGLAVRLTDERLAHILDHPEMVGLKAAISESLKDPAQVVQSISDGAARLYYRFYSGTRLGDNSYAWS